MPVTDEELTALLVDARAASAAGASTLGRYSAATVTAQVKGEFGNVVTEADLAAERAAREVLEQRRPQDTVSGEELATTGAGSRIRWSIDPLDGTTNFTRSIPFYCTSVAAYDAVEDVWLVGAVDAPALGRRYWAARGQGAWRETAGAVQQLHGPRLTATTALLGMGLSYSESVRAEQLAALPALMADFSDVRRLGSAALDLCLVADGTLDAFIESDLAEHDWAAGAVIAREAGLAVEVPARPGGIVSARAIP